MVYGLENYNPGPVHLALKRLEDLGILKGIATQNIDMLHQKAGSSNVQEVHGSPMVHHCRRCGKAKGFEDICNLLKGLHGNDVPRCECGGAYKPDITFFGESLPEAAFSNATRLASEADVFLVLGTSLTVFPAASLPRYTLRNGGELIIVNAQPTSLDDHAFACFNDLKMFSEAILTA